jgi:hypothetical protein
LQNREISVCPTFQEVCSGNSSSSSSSASSEENSGNEIGVHGDVSHEAKGHGDIPEGVVPGERNIVEDPESVRFAYRASMWSKQHSTFHQDPQ